MPSSIIVMHHKPTYGTDSKKQIREKARIIHQASINQQDIKSLLVPLPHLEIQIQLAHCIDVVERRIEAERARASVLATPFSSLLHHLMTGRLRVNDLRVPERVGG